MAEFVVVTGMSGAGRSTVARALENVGYYVVDNLPQALLIPLAELSDAAGETGRRIAVVLDARSFVFSQDLVGSLRELRERGHDVRVVFMDASDDALVRRFDSVRRAHPLQASGRLADGIAAERALLADTRAVADIVLDTTQLNPTQLRRRVEELFVEGESSVKVTLLSFGHKYGLPLDADLAVDMRFLPNPHWVPELRLKTGQSAEVQAYILKQEGAQEFLARYAAMIAELVPAYGREGKQHVTVAVGCTGGKHRSVASAEELGRLLAERGLRTRVVHRDVGRE